MRKTWDIFQEKNHKSGNYNSTIILLTTNKYKWLQISFKKLILNAWYNRTGLFSNTFLKFSFDDICNNLMIKEKKDCAFLTFKKILRLSQGKKIHLQLCMYVKLILII